MAADPICGKSHSGPVFNESFKVNDQKYLENVVVYIQGYCNSNSGGGANDDIKVTGLPYTCASLPSGGNIRHTGNWAIGSRYKIECDDLTAYTYGGQTIINLLVPSNGGTGTQLKTNQVDQNTCELYATATYRVA